MPQGSERPRREEKRALFPAPVRNDDIASSTYLAVKHHDLFICSVGSVKRRRVIGKEAHESDVFRTNSQVIWRRQYVDSLTLKAVTILKSLVFVVTGVKRAQGLTEAPLAQFDGTWHSGVSRDSESRVRKGRLGRAVFARGVFKASSPVLFNTGDFCKNKREECRFSATEQKQR